MAEEVRKHIGKVMVKCVKCGKEFEETEGVQFTLLENYFGKGFVRESLKWCRSCWEGDPSKARVFIKMEWRG